MSTDKLLDESALTKSLVPNCFRNSKKSIELFKTSNQKYLIQEVAISLWW